MRAKWRYPCAHRLARSALRSLLRSGKHWEQSWHREASRRLDRGIQGRRYAHTSRSPDPTLRLYAPFPFCQFMGRGYYEYERFAMHCDDIENRVPADRQMKKSKIWRLADDPCLTNRD